MQYFIIFKKRQVSYSKIFSALTETPKSALIIACMVYLIWRNQNFENTEGSSFF